MSYWEDRYIDYLAEEDGQIGGDAWRDDYNPRVSLEKKLMSAYESVKCPECNGEMVSRTGKFGVFWGCKDFPKCKGTRDSEGRSKADREAWKAQQEGYEPDSSEANQVSFNRTKRDWNVK